MAFLYAQKGGRKMNKPKIVAVDSGVKVEMKNKYEKSIANMWGMLPYVTQEWEVKAKFLKAKYDGLIKEGFTEEQAMQIVKTRPIFE